MILPLIPLRPAGPGPARRALPARGIRLLVGATIAYNVVEAAVAITARRLQRAPASNASK